MDIVERLRIRIHTSADETALTNEAAEEIELLREQVEHERSSSWFALVELEESNKQIERLHQQNAELASALKHLVGWHDELSMADIEQLHQQNAELVPALKYLVDWHNQQNAKAIGGH